MSVRNIEDLELDDVTGELLRDERDDQAEEFGVESRQGSLYYDATEGHIIRCEKFFEDLRQIREIISLDSCTGDMLEEWMRLAGLTKNPEEATQAVYYVTFVGDPPEVGEDMSCDGHMFTLGKIGDDYVITSEETGTEMNTLPAGLPVIPDVDVDGLIAATLGALAVPAVDEEDDDVARDRMNTSFSGPSENANKAQLQAWCEEVSGVGQARIVPLAYGANTAQGVIISTSGGVPSSAVVNAVQEYVDPGHEGMGEGKATIGLHFYADAATAVTIDVSVTVTTEDSADMATIREDIEAAIKSYFASLSLNRETDEVVVRSNRIGVLLSQIEGVTDYYDLVVDEGVTMIECEVTEIPVLGTLTVTKGT